MANRPLQLTLNGQPVGPVEVPDDLAMIDYLHEHQNLTGSRLGCGQGICHACVVIVDNPDGTSEEVRTCITGAHYFEGKKVRTIEGHAKQDRGRQPDAEPDPAEVRRPVRLPVQLLRARLRQRRHGAGGNRPAPAMKKSEVENRIEASLGHHICRCTGYVRYYDATRTVLNDLGLVKEG
jgi:Aerobic-type carbon monoxide dehydrogenase, small subunit CoxS/CutS homologs